MVVAALSQLSTNLQLMTCRRVRGKWVVATEALYEGKHPTKKKIKIHKDNYGRNSECIQSAVSLELDPGIY